MALGELQRQAYLQAMGVKSYAPRLVLPGALASQQCDLSELKHYLESDASESAPGLSSPASVAGPMITPESNPADREPLLSIQSGPATSHAAATQALFDEPAKTSKPSVRSVVDDLAAETKASSAQAAPHFVLSVSRGGQFLILDDGLPGHLDPTEYLQLLQNILFALGAGKQVLNIDAFVWPMSKSSHIDQSETAARQTLQAFLGKLAEREKLHYVLIMGEAAARYVSEHAVSKGELIQHGRLPVSLLNLESAVAMLADPSLKRDAWRQLQPLRARLQQNPDSPAH